MSIFDKKIDRSGTYSVKYESRYEKFKADNILPLWVADMDLPSAECVTKALVKRASHPIYGYTIYPERFYRAIEGWMLKRHGWRIDEGSIVPIPGVVPALNFLVTALSEPGDGVLIQPPVYHPFFRLGKNHGRNLIENPLKLTGERYEIDFEDFEQRAKEAKLFILCSPHNPVGRVWEQEELEKMAHICMRNGVTIVSDEVHADIVYQGQKHIPIASLAKEIAEITVTLNAPSKTFNIAGLNTAYAIVNNSSLRRRLDMELKRYDLTMGNLFGIEALIAAYEGGDAWLGELLNYLKGNIEVVTKVLNGSDCAIKALRPEATYLMWLDCRTLGLDDSELEEFFIKRAKLGLNSGVSFGKDGSGFMRLNIACSRSILKEAMKRIKSAL
ncbi:MAG: PatB family C-S lyase [Hydrogenimonas sp.]|nr:PatB family C-S lyase [Hydrogenimonas sp.]